VTNANLHGQVDATISGPSYSHFSVKLTNDNPLERHDDGQGHL